MKKYYLILTVVLFIQSIQLFSHVEKPNFEESIHFFEERDLGKEMKKQNLTWSEQIITVIVSNPVIRELIHFASGDRTMREIGHQKERIESYSGKKIKPDRIILTGSGKETLEETKASFLRQPTRLAHNFFIDRNGKIYPVTKKDESVENALTHRPFSVGVACHIDDNGKQEWDLNAHSITISIIGTDKQPTTTEQTASLVHLIQWLSQEFDITPDMVLDYGCVAQPYGRRKPQSHLPWKELHQAKIALYPTINREQAEQAYIRTISFHPILWLSAALQKLGYLCSNVTDPKDPQFILALQSFQQHHQCDVTDGTPSTHTFIIVNAMLQEKENIKPNDKRWPPSMEITIKEPNSKQ